MAGISFEYMQCINRFECCMEKDEATGVQLLFNGIQIHNRYIRYDDDLGSLSQRMIGESNFASNTADRKSVV